jgi:iron(III) transport system ATP-binding protein
MKVDLEHVSKRFDQTEVLRDLNLEVREGEFFFILGPSGCGKTTLLRIIAGFESPSEGDVRFDGKSVLKEPPNRRHIGMVFQNYALWPHLTVRDNVRFGLDILKIPPRDADRRITEVLETVQMTGYEQRFPNQLSGGQQQRVALARAIVTRPGLLLLDEPLSNLDARLRLEMRDELLHVQKATGITTVYVTHDQKEALSMADRMVILKDGRIMQAGTPLDVYRSPQSPFVAGFMGETNFSEGSVREARIGEVEVETPLGRMEGPAEPGLFHKGERVLVSIRPEAIRLAEEVLRHPAVVFKANVEKTVFMGEAEHFWLRAGEMPIKMLLINPKPGIESPGTELILSVAWDDCVLLKPDEATA